MGNTTSDPAFDPPPVEHQPPANPNMPAEPTPASPAHDPAPPAPQPDPPAPEPASDHGAAAALGGAPEAGTVIDNPAEPLAPTVVPGATDDPAPFINQNAAPVGYPKTKYHPVHGAITLADPGQEAGLISPKDWFDLPELADAARTYTEAAMTAAHNIRTKLTAHDDAGQPVVRNSVQADQSIRAGNLEPL